MEQQEVKKKKFFTAKRKALIYIVLFILIINAGFLFFVSNFIIVNEQIVSRHSQYVDFSSSDISDISELEKLFSPTEIDLRGNELSLSDIRRLQEHFPDADIKWSVVLSDSLADYNAEAIVINAADLSNTDSILCMKNLKTIDAYGIDCSADSTLFDKMTAFVETMSSYDVSWNIPMAKSSIDCHATSIDIDNIDISLLDRLKYVKNLRSIDARGYDYDVVSRVKESFGNCEILWDIEICSKRYPSDTAEITIGKEATVQDIERLLLFPNLKSVDASGCTEYDTLLDVSGKMPDCTFKWTGTLYGFKITNSTKTLNFNKKKVKDVSKLSKELEKLKYFPSLTKIDMCDCGVSTSQMGKWVKKYPNVKFVWKITFGNSIKKWTIRTDIKVFSTLRGKPVGNENLYADLFKYCTDLVALDLGHNYIHDLSMITNLKKLQGLIITDNYVSDLSPLTELPDLVFLEANKNKIADLSPLAKCKNLIHVDVYHNKLSNISPMAECKNLKMLVVVETKVSAKQRAALQKKLPKCKIVYQMDNRDIAARDDDIRKAFRIAFSNYPSVKKFDDWQHIEYKPGTKLKYPPVHIKK